MLVLSKPIKSVLILLNYELKPCVCFILCLATFIYYRLALIVHFINITSY